MYSTQVILVDENDRQSGVMEKLEAHRKGLLHRAFSIFVLNSKGEMLLQRRALQKYHSPGLWTNACCSHPLPGETTLVAASRRLVEEMGFKCQLQEIDHILYRVEFDNALIEHEYDHILIGYYDGPVLLNLEEVVESKYLALEEIDGLLKNQADMFTYWFKIAYPLVKDYLNRQ
jgi:isopentenyl-diphosphate Delta-isomerase